MFIWIYSFAKQTRSHLFTTQDLPHQKNNLPGAQMFSSFHLAFSSSDSLHSFAALLNVA